MTDSWNPATEQDLQKAIEQGLVRESHTLEVKTQPPPARQNTDIAIDLASLAVDGGRIIYGIRQPVGTGPTQRSPFVVGDLPERLDQVARGGAIDGPLRIRSQYIASLEYPGKGYLVVTIPISPDAPHQVDGRYRGRGDKTNIVLSDAAVRRLHTTRAQRVADLVALVDAEIERDPTGADMRTQGHLFLVAQPAVFDPERLSRTLTSHDAWRGWLFGAFRGSLQRGAFPNAPPPSVTYLSAVSGRQSGYALHTYEMGEDRHIRPNGTHPAVEDDLLDIEARDDGGIRVFCGRASYARRRGPERAIAIVLHDLIISMTRSLVYGARSVAEAADYLGAWGFGIALVGIGRASPTTEATGGYAERTIDDYQRVTSASWEELVADVDAPAKRLLGAFYRSIGFDDFIPRLQ